MVCRRIWSLVLRHRPVSSTDVHNTQVFSLLGFSRYLRHRLGLFRICEHDSVRAVVLVYTFRDAGLLSATIAGYFVLQFQRSWALVVTPNVPLRYP
jgi:hypothetical protein